jgi:hypothetical protein
MKVSSESFVYFYFVPFAAEFRCIETVLHCQSQTLQHKPCRLLRNPKRAVNLHAGDPVLAIAEHPESGHPLIQAERRILNDRAYLDGELLIAATAEPQLARLDEIVLGESAARTNDLAAGPAHFHGVLEGALRIGEVNNRFLQCLRRFHEKNIRRLFACVRAWRIGGHMTRLLAGHGELW